MEGELVTSQGRMRQFGTSTNNCLLHPCRTSRFEVMQLSLYHSVVVKMAPTETKTLSVLESVEIEIRPGHSETKTLSSILLQLFLTNNFGL